MAIGIAVSSAQAMYILPTKKSNKGCDDDDHHDDDDDDDDDDDLPKESKKASEKRTTKVIIASFSQTSMDSGIIIACSSKR